ncbi:MAG: efflux RND transporter periplasmic adaptor subunit [Thermoanaerobaculia bacterium]
MIRPRFALLRLTLLLTSLSSLALLSFCSKSSAEGSGSERPAVAVEAALVAPSDIEDTIAVVGTLSAKFEGEVKAEYSGTITEVFVTEWVPVKKGTLLARFDTREPEAELKAATAARLQAQVGANRARRELERSEQLKAAGLATQQSLDDARTAAEAAAAEVRASEAREEMAKTRLAKTAVVAPMDGVIAERTVNPGDFIENMGSPAPMFRVVDNRKLELTVSVPSSAIETVRLGQPLRFSSDAIAGRTFEGVVSFINPAADVSSRTVRVIAIVDNADGALKSGLFAKGSIVTGERKGVLSIPRSALVTWDPATRVGIVYVVAGDRAARKEVVTGTSAGDQLPVEKGVSAGDLVVTRGAFNLKDGDRVAVAKGKAADMGSPQSGERSVAPGFSRGSTVAAMITAPLQRRDAGGGVAPLKRRSPDVRHAHPRLKPGATDVSALRAERALRSVGRGLLSAHHIPTPLSLVHVTGA